MQTNLSDKEARVIGCLMEKSVVTPEQYPLTLNSLTNACNQKSSRNPVMSLDPGVVKRTARELQDKHFVRIDENFKRGVEKYIQTFCNTRLGDLQFDPAQYAIVTLLLLRGPQTPGELRSRSGRLHTFADNEAVVDSLRELMEREGGPVVVKLPRTPGRKDSEYMHLFSGPVDIEEHVNKSQVTADAGSSRHDRVSDLEQRVSTLEAEVAELKDLIKDIT